MSVLNPDNNQIIYLTTASSISGCDIKTIDGVLKYVCAGGRTFRSARERWWFIAVSRCDKNSATAVSRLRFCNFTLFVNDVDLNFRLVTKRRLLCPPPITRLSTSTCHMVAVI